MKNPLVLTIALLAIILSLLGFMLQHPPEAAVYHSFGHDIQEYHK